MTHKIGGKKFSGNHTTYIDAAERIVKYANSDDRVKKISLGIISSCSTGRGARSIKTKDIDVGLEIKIRGNIYSQVIRLYLSDPQKDRHDIVDQLKKIF